LIDRNIIKSKTLNKPAGLFFVFVLSILMIFTDPVSASALSAGDVVNNVEIRDANNDPMMIPGLGEKVVLIFYPDPEVASQNDSFAEAMKKTDFSDEKLMAMGIVNMKDAPFFPDVIIRFMIRKELEKDKRAVIYTDPERSLQRSWGLPDCNDKFGVILIDKNRVVQFVKLGRLNDKEIKFVIGKIVELVD